MFIRCVSFAVFLFIAAAFPARADTPTEQDWTNAAEIVATPPADYLSCMSPGDCVLVGDACGAVRPVNKTHAEQYALLARRLAPTVNCAAPGNRQPPDIDCEQGTCKIQTIKP